MYRYFSHHELVYVTLNHLQIKSPILRKQRLILFITNVSYLLLLEA